MKKFSLLLAGLLACTLTANAIVTFSLVGEVITATDGDAFTVGEDVTVTFTTSSEIGEPNITNNGTHAEWYQQTTDTPIIYSDMTISDAVGIFTRPPEGAGEALLNTWDAASALNLNQFSDTGLGLIRNGEELWSMEISLDVSGLTNPTYASDSSVRPETIFLNGTYAINSTTFTYIYFNNFTSFYEIDFTSITVSGSQVPEPGAYALSFGGLVLLGVMLRRKVKRG